MPRRALTPEEWRRMARHLRRSSIACAALSPWERYDWEETPIYHPALTEVPMQDRPDPAEDWQSFVETPLPLPLPRVPCPACQAACVPAVTAEGWHMLLDPLYTTYTLDPGGHDRTTEGHAPAQRSPALVQHAAICPNGLTVRVPYPPGTQVAYRPAHPTAACDADGWHRAPWVVLAVAIEVHAHRPLIWRYTLERVTPDPASVGMERRPIVPVGAYQLRAWQEGAPDAGV